MARFRVFISYTSADREIADNLRARLIQDSSIDCFAFEHDMRLGDNIIEVVRERLHWCNFFIPVISRENHARPWLRHEIGTAMIRSFDRECTLIPVLSSASETDLSADLRQYHWIAADDACEYVESVKSRVTDEDQPEEERRWDLFRPLPCEFDLPALLSWRVRLSALYGRDQELEELLVWANDEQPGARVRIVSAPGGAGKTRLAAELAVELWKSGWDTQFIQTSAGTPSTRGCASLWIVDYPEEQQNLASFFRYIRQHRHLHKIRVLMLTRLPRDWWLNHSQLRTAHASDLLGETFDLEFEALSGDDCIRLYRDVISTVGHWFDKSIPEVSDSRLLEWRAVSPEHRLPLYVTALALHSVGVESPTLELNARKIMRELVMRERSRVDAFGSEDPDTPQEWPSRTLGLAAMTDCLDGNILRQLAREELELGMPPPNKIVDAVRRTPLWNDTHHGVVPLRPDIFAAAFLQETLSSRPDMAKHWLWATIEPQLRLDSASLRDRIGRLIFDVEKISEPHEPNLSSWLRQMVKDDPQKAMDLRDIALEDRPPEFLLPLLREINEAVLSGDGISVEERIRVHRALGYQLARLEMEQEARPVFETAVELCRENGNEIELAECLSGLSGVIDTDADACIATATEAVELQRKLAADGDVVRRGALARSLNGYALALKGLSDYRLKALSALEECVELNRELLNQVPASQRHVHEDNLARALFNLANEQWDAGEHKLAHLCSEESVQIRRTLYGEYRWRYARYFAMSLSQFSEISKLLGNIEHAIDVARETIEIYGHLYKANPAQFGVNLVSSLGHLTSAEEAADQKDLARQHRREQVQLIKKLLADGGIARYTQILSDVTLELVNDGYNAVTTQPELAIDTCTEAIDLLETIRSNNRQAWDVRMHYVLIGGFLNRGNASRGAKAKNAIADYHTGVDEALSLKAERGFFSEVEVARELCLLNSCIERLKLDEIEQSLADLRSAIDCEVGIKAELRDEWPISAHGQVLMSLKVLRGLFDKFPAEEQSQVVELMAEIARGLLHTGDQKPEEMIRNLLALSLDVVETNRDEAISLLDQAVGTLVDAQVADHQTASFYNDTAYQIGSIVECLEDSKHIHLAAKLARIATEKAVDRQHQIWGLARETLGFVTGLLPEFDSDAAIREESKTAFREAIDFFNARGDNSLVDSSVADWEKVHGPYEGP